MMSLLFAAPSTLQWRVLALCVIDLFLFFNQLQFVICVLSSIPHCPNFLSLLSVHIPVPSHFPLRFIIFVIPRCLYILLLSHHLSLPLFAISLLILPFLCLLLPLSLTHSPGLSSTFPVILMPPQNTTSPFP